MKSLVSLAGSLLGGFFIGIIVCSLNASADVGMPKSFDVLANVSGPIISGSLSELHLDKFVLAKGEACGRFTNFDYKGPAVNLTLGSEVYVLDSAVPMSIAFLTDNCDLKISNLDSFLIKFNHTKLNVSVAIEVDFTRNLIQISSRSLSGAAGAITSKF